MIDKQQLPQDLDSLLEFAPDARTDTSYRVVLASSLQLIGYDDDDIKVALDRLYKVN